jgi:GAF domain-containing protein
VEWSFCRYPVATRTRFVIEDAERHPALRDNPLVLGGGLRCYAGAPLVASNGAAVGALCVAGPEARRFTAAEVAGLERAAAAVMARLETGASR